MALSERQTYRPTEENRAFRKDPQQLDDKNARSKLLCSMVPLTHSSGREKVLPGDRSQHSGGSGGVRRVWTLRGHEGPARGLETACVFAQLVSTWDVQMTTHEVFHKDLRPHVSYFLP